VDLPHLSHQSFPRRLVMVAVPASKHALRSCPEVTVLPRPRLLFGWLARPEGPLVCQRRCSWHWRGAGRAACCLFADGAFILPAGQGKGGMVAGLGWRAATWARPHQPTHRKEERRPVASGASWAQLAF